MFLVLFIVGMRCVWGISVGFCYWIDVLWKIKNFITFSRARLGLELDEFFVCYIGVCCWLMLMCEMFLNVSLCMFGDIDWKVCWYKLFVYFVWILMCIECVCVCCWFWMCLLMCWCEEFLCEGFLWMMRFGVVDGLNVCVWFDG